MTGRVLKRPLGGWRARVWREEVCQWLGIAVFVVGSSAFSTLLFKAIDFLALEIAAL